MAPVVIEHFHSAHQCTHCIPGPFSFHVDDIDCHRSYLAPSKVMTKNQEQYEKKLCMQKSRSCESSMQDQLRIACSNPHMSDSTCMSRQQMESNVPAQAVELI